MALKRVGFKRKTPMRRTKYEGPSYEVEPRAISKTAVKALRVGTYSGTTSAAIPKCKPVRSEAYRRAVASLSCVHCGRMGCQCAHANTGKGMALKACDLESFPLCPACHRAFDQEALFSKEDRRRIEPQWAAATRAAVEAAGTWPKRLAKCKEHTNV
jgi:hypothetical protein